MRSAFKVLRDSRKIEKLQKRLADCQEKFMTALTMDMREGVMTLLEKQGILNDEIQNYSPGACVASHLAPGVLYFITKVSVVP